MSLLSMPPSFATKANEDHEFGYEFAMRVGGVMLQRLQATRLQLLDYGQPR